MTVFLSGSNVSRVDGHFWAAKFFGTAATLPGAFEDPETECYGVVFKLKFWFEDVREGGLFLCDSVSVGHG